MDAFKRSKAGLDSDFSFFFTKAREPYLPNYLVITGRGEGKLMLNAKWNANWI